MVLVSCVQVQIYLNLPCNKLNIQDNDVPEGDVHGRAVHADQRGRVHHLVPDTKQTEHTKVGVVVHLPMGVLKLLPLQRNPDVCMCESHVD